MNADLMLKTLQSVTSAPTTLPGEPAQDAELLMGMRVAYRTIVRELGFMNTYMGGTHLTPSQVHILIELEAQPSLTAALLKDVLYLDKSTISRLLSTLVQDGYLKKTASSNDNRVQSLALTIKARRALAQVHRQANKQFGMAIKGMRTDEAQTVLAGLQIFARALRDLHSVSREDRVVRAVEREKG